MEKSQKTVVIGPAHPYRGGIAAFNERLAKELVSRGEEVRMLTFTLQYPSFLFPGKTQYSTEPAPAGLDITRCINSINPFNWIKVGRMIAKMKPDTVIIQYWLPYMAPCLGTIARVVKMLCGARVKAVIHNMMPHEARPGDKLFSRYFCSSVDAFAAMAEPVLRDVDIFDRNKPRMLHPHPLYDNFGTPVSKEEACERLGIEPDKRYLLFFGLIRDYKGLDLLIEALAAEGLRSRDDFKVIIAGEFYSHPEKYLDRAAELGVNDHIVWKTEYVPDSEVRYYFSAAEMMVLPYRSATQSGVTQIAYHFGRPMLVTDVGGLAQTVPDGVAGYVVSPDKESIADAMICHLKAPKDFSEGLAEQKKKYSWASMCDALDKI